MNHIDTGINGDEVDRFAIERQVLGFRAEWSPSSFLGSASTAIIKEFCAVGTLRQYERSQTLIEEGDDTDDVFLLLSSTVKVTAQLDNGGSALIAVRVGGDVVGELAASDGHSRLASVRSCGLMPTVVLVIEAPHFRRVLADHADEALRLAAVIGAKLRTATRRRVDYSGAPTRVRLARLLLELAEDHGQQVGHSVVIRVDLTQVELGSLIGVTEATAQRAMRRLRADGLITTAERRPTIRDFDALRRIADHTAR